MTNVTNFPADALRNITEEQFQQILESDGPVAKQFQRLLFREVLPEIRRTGSYHGPRDAISALLAAVIEEARGATT